MTIYFRRDYNTNLFNLNDIVLSKDNSKYCVTFEIFEDMYFQHEFLILAKFNGLIRSYLEYGNHNLFIRTLDEEFLKENKNQFKLNKYQKFFNFVGSNIFSEKDLLYNIYKSQKKLFQNEYNYMKETYIYPQDKEIINTYRPHKQFDMITMNGYTNINEILKYKGEYVNNNGLIYIGLFINNNLNGKGLNYNPSNDSLYRGDFKNFNKDGYGEESCNEYKYKGEYDNDKKNGKGEMIFKNKDIYKGSIFIPIIGDLVDAVSATGGLKAGNYDELRSRYQTKNYVEVPHEFVKQ